MSVIPADSGNPNRDLQATDYKPSGELKTTGADVALVVGSASRSEAFIQNKQWGLLWRDSDLLYQSPRPMSVFENTYILEPNVQRFTVAKVVNAVVPQLYKGLFYQDPPLILRPRPGTSQNVTDAKTALYSTLLDQCNFKTETKWGLEQMAHQGTGIWKWGIRYEKIVTRKRRAAVKKVTAGPAPHQEDLLVPEDTLPQVTETYRWAPRPFIESKELSRVLVSPHTPVGDIRRSPYVIDVRYMNWYQFTDLKKAIASLPEGHPDKDGWDFPDDKTIMSWWMPPTDAGTPGQLTSDQAAYIKGVVHHAEEINVQVSPDLLFKPFEVLEYWDKDRKILVIDRKNCFFSGKNPFNQHCFLSANWWNRPKAFYGMGLGLIIGQNQRVDQGAINAILKILSFGVNPIYLRKRDSNSPTQMIRTGLGKILTVDTPVEEAYKLMETPKVPPDVWAALSESEKATESSSGADQTLVQGSSAGPRSSMGRTAGGASLIAGASATRLDGPLDNFIEQVFKPFLYILDMLIFKYFSDAEIFRILGEEKGKDFSVDLQEFHDAVFDYEVLAGAALAAKRTMSQSMTLITQLLENPNIAESLADNNQEYIDFKEIIKMWMESTEWKNFNDIIKPMTQDMKDRLQQKSEAAQAQSKLAIQSTLNQQKAEQKAVQQQQDAQNRIQRDLVVEAFRNSSQGEATEGAPSYAGVGGGDFDPQLGVQE